MSNKKIDRRLAKLAVNKETLRHLESLRPAQLRRAAGGDIDWTAIGNTIGNHTWIGC